MKPMYSKINGEPVVRNVADERVAAMLKRGWSLSPLEKPVAKPAKKKKAK